MLQVKIVELEIRTLEMCFSSVSPMRGNWFYLPSTIIRILTFLSICTITSLPLTGNDTLVGILTYIGTEWQNYYINVNN